VLGIFLIITHQNQSNPPIYLVGTPFALLYYMKYTLGMSVSSQIENTNVYMIGKVYKVINQGSEILVFIRFHDKSVEIRTQQD
jgi:hypothetical protein